MQDDLDAAFPQLDIEIVGINEAGFESGNGTITSEVDTADVGADGVDGTADDVTAIRDIPWLQDVDADSDGSSDLWEESWPVTYRDVIILDAANVQVGVYNLTNNSLADAGNYDALRQMFINAASTR